MKWNIKDNGESIEKLAAKRLDVATIAKYNSFWAMYIGCASGKPIAIKDITEEQNRKRLLIGQWNYTLLYNLLLIKLPKGSSSNIKKKDYVKVVNSIRQYTEVVHLLYNSVEIVGKFNGVFPMHKIDTSNFRSFIVYRNNIAHNIRPFIKIQDEVHYPSNYEIFENLNHNFIWSLDEPQSIQYQSFAQFKTFAYEKIRGLLYMLIDKGTNIMKTELGEKTIGNDDLTDYLLGISGMGIPPASGSTSFIL
jgi:hypothetical protein